MRGVRELPLPDGSRMAYFDEGGRGRPLVCLHGHAGRGELWGPLASALAPARRVIAPDLPGHGESDPAGGDWLADTVERVTGLVEGLGLREAALLGHSSGGVAAYTLAARRPELVGALVAVEAPAVVSSGDGWGVRADPDAQPGARMSLLGDHWLDWRASRMPGLVIRGADSPRLGHAHAREMAARRSRTKLVELARCGHVPQDEDPEAFAAAVRTFLDGVA
jgi:esterase